MRSLPFADSTFDWVLNFFTSFGYFEGERENFRVLEEVVRILRPGGRFLIDLLNPGPAIRTLRPADRSEVEGRTVEIERWYDPARRRVNKRIRVSSGSEAQRSYLESVRLYSVDEVTIGLRWAGLEVTDRYGNFEGEDYNDDSERLILVASKPTS